MNHRRRVEDLERAVPGVAPGAGPRPAWFDAEIEALIDDAARSGRFADREEAAAYVHAELRQVIAEVKGERPGAT